MNVDRMRKRARRAAPPELLWVELACPSCEYTSGPQLETVAIEHSCPGNPGDVMNLYTQADFVPAEVVAAAGRIEAARWKPLMDRLARND